MPPQNAQFEVFLSGYSGTPEEWRQSMSLPASELARLTPEQKAEARRRGATEEDYQRILLREQLAEKRLRGKAQRLGERAHEVLEALGKRKYLLRSVLFEGMKGRWLLRVETSSRVVDVPVSDDLADEVVNYEILAALDNLKETIASGVGHRKAVAK